LERDATTNPIACFVEVTVAVQTLPVIQAIAQLVFLETTVGRVVTAVDIRLFDEDVVEQCF
jgi:hypothetical protein